MRFRSIFANSDNSAAVSESSLFLKSGYYTVSATDQPKKSKINGRVGEEREERERESERVRERARGRERDRGR